MVKSRDLKVNYEHIKCNCGGIIGCRSLRETLYQCDRCGKTYLLYQLDYDDIYINQMTGWTFPVKKKESFNGIHAIR